MFVRNAVLVTFTALTALTLLPAAAAAQEPTRIEPRDPAFRRRIELVTTRRARLGVVVDMEATDSGATLESVTPGGPAAKAGLKSGDIITKVDNDAVSSGLQLIELVAKLEPNTRISVEYRRGASKATTELTTGNEPAWEFGFPPGERVWSMRVPDLERFKVEAGRLQYEPMVGGGYTFRFGGPLSDVELAPLNADLGAYFGTTEGVLVISVPSGSTLGLKGGDVVLSVDGRKTSTPSGLLRILRSYDSGEAIRLEVMRNKARQTISGTMPRPRNED